jgi:hypothetical protein
VFFKEPFGRTRILAATLVAAGIVVLNLALRPLGSGPRCRLACYPVNWPATRRSRRDARLPGSEPSRRWLPSGRW